LALFWCFGMRPSDQLFGHDQSAASMLGVAAWSRLSLATPFPVLPL